MLRYYQIVRYLYKPCKNFKRFDASPYFRNSFEKSNLIDKTRNRLEEKTGIGEKR